MRVEPVVDAALAEGAGFTELVARFDDALEQAVAAGVRGFKRLPLTARGCR